MIKLFNQSIERLHLKKTKRLVQASLIVGTLNRTASRKQSPISSFLSVIVVALGLAAPLTGSVRAQGLEHLVTGSSLISFFFDAEQHWEFSASQSADGTVRGQLELVTTQPDGGRIHGSIYCVQSDPSTGIARLAALVEQSTTPLAPVGSYVIWTVQDNGPGADDATSDLFPATLDDANFHCATGFILQLVPNERGQIAVHK